jgi:hypothetical protein
MTIFLFTAVIVIIFFPLIYFMWSSFFSMLYWQWKFRRMTDEERDQLLIGPHDTLIPQQAKLSRVQTGLFNFVTADEFIADLSRPDLPARQLRKILQELSTSKGMIKQQQQDKLRHLLTACQDRQWQGEDQDLAMLVQLAMLRLDEAKIID